MKDRPLSDALRFVMERNRVLLGVSMFLFAMDALTYSVSHMSGTSIPIVVTWAIIRALARGYFRPGLLRSLDSARRGGALDVDELTSGFDSFEHAMGVQLATDLIVVASLVVGGLPGLGLVVASVEMARPELYAPGLALAMTGGFALYLYAYTGVRFSEHVVALERRGMWSALSRSWKLARGKRLRILHVIFVAATLELAALVWGLGALGFGVFFTIPLLRLAGDHALVAMFTKLQDEDRETKESPASSSSSWVLRHASARGASLPEYVLLLVCVMLVAAGAFRRLGATASSNASKGAAVLAGTSGSTGSPSSGSSASGLSSMGSAVGNFISDFASGFVKGDFSTSTGAGKIAGQVVSGFIPIYGQIAAARDVGAALRDISNGNKDAWQHLGLASVGLLPGLGGAAKATLKGAAEAAQVAKAAEEVAVTAKAAQAAEEAAALAKAAQGETAAAEAAAAAAAKDSQLAKDAQQVEQAAGEAAGVTKAIPPEAQKALDYAKAKNGAAQPGYKGNKPFVNDGRDNSQILPQTTAEGTPITYKEYDTTPKVRGVNRTSERVVIGSDGKAWYTSDHYEHFTPIP